MIDTEHRQLAYTLKRAREGAISGYRCALMDELYKDWKRVDAPEKMCHSVKEKPN